MKNRRLLIAESLDNSDNGREKQYEENGRENEKHHRENDFDRSFKSLSLNKLAVSFTNIVRL